jgi:hypothetical protein
MSCSGFQALILTFLFTSAKKNSCYASKTKSAYSTLYKYVVNRSSAMIKRSRLATSTIHPVSPATSSWIAKYSRMKRRVTQTRHFSGNALNKERDQGHCKAIRKTHTINP